MAKNLFTLKKREVTEELHLFRSELGPEGQCQTESESICKRMEYDEAISNIFICKDESFARKKCAEKGREVCGTCVSTLYADY